MSLPPRPSDLPKLNEREHDEDGRRAAQPDGAAARRAARRFEELSAGGYDVLPVIR